MPFLPPNQQRQSTEGTSSLIINYKYQSKLQSGTHEIFKNKNPCSWLEIDTLNGKYTSEQAIHHSNQQNITIT